MQQNWYFILNPTSGGGQAFTVWAKISEAMEAKGLTYEVGFTERPLHAEQLVKEALSQGFRKIAAVGGDGTIHEVINGIMKQRLVPVGELEFGAIPIGTGNDWIKTHKIPKNYHKNIEILQKGRLFAHDIAKITWANGRTEYANNVIGLAYDAFVAEKTLGKNKPGALSKIYYLLLVLKWLWKYSGTRMKIEAAEHSFEGEVFCVNVGICIFNGGGMQTVPFSVADDGLLDVTIIENQSKARILWEIPKLFLGNIHKANKTHCFKTQRIRLNGISTIEADGEMLGEIPVEIEVLPRVLRVRV